MRPLDSKYVDDPSYWSIRQVATCRRVVFTNGCFDLLHTGHLAYLTAARAFGDVLIVGVNDDASVKALKGETRSLNTLEDRMRMLAALEIVDAVTPLTDTSNVGLLRAIQPAVWAKGDDYTLETLNPKEVSVARSLGITIRIVPHPLQRLVTTQIGALRN